MQIKKYSAGSLLWHYLKPLQQKVLWLAVLLFGGIALQLVAPQVMRRFLDLAQNGETGTALTWTAVFFFILSIGQKGLVLLTAYASEDLGWTATNNLRADLADKPKKEQAELVGKAVAERAKAAGVTRVAFDRSGYKYHGRVKALADAAREAGLEF